ncbi:MAG: hydratase [Alphaproteobacteria bacterium]|nr:hydratase [Alphaproteobacteria bacterium]
MLSESQAKEAAESIWRCWQEGTVIDALPAPLRPTNRVEGYAVQAYYETLSGQPIAGWKIAATSAAGQSHIGVDGPIAGRLLAAHVFEDGATLDFGHNRLAVAEPEFAFRMNRDLPPRTQDYSVDEVLAAVGTLHAAIEIPDSRFEPVERAGAAQLIADNACAHDFVLGPAMPETWRGTDLSQHKVTVTVDGKETHEGIGANVLGDPRIALAWIANELSRHGIGLKAGHVVTTGTCATPIPIAPGGSMTADFGALGSVSARFAKIA